MNDKAANDPVDPASPNTTELSEPAAVFLRFRRVFGDGSLRSSDSRKRAKREPGSSIPFGHGRDPEGLGTIFDLLSSRMGWTAPLAQSELIASWSDIAGIETAAHSTPVGIDEGVLTVQCDSTGWATQLRLLRVHLMNEIASRYPDAGINSLRFEGPNAPSWKRGPRSIPGRGPRDTYG